MKRSRFLIVVAIAVALASCNQNDKPTMKSGLNLTNLDKTVNPSEDFYQYACGGWMKEHPLQAEHARYGSFDKLAEDNQQEVRELIEELAKETHQEGSIAQKIGSLYKLGMDSVKLENDGVEPLRASLESIASITNKEQFVKETAHFQKLGLSPFFVMYVGADEMNSTMNIINFHQAGLGMPDRDYYVSDEESMKNIRTAYHDHLTKMFQLAGYTHPEAEKAAVDVVTIENKLAQATYSRVELRDPMKNYNKMTTAELQTLVPAFNWSTYFAELGLNETVDLNVCQKDFFQTFGTIFSQATTDELKSYYTWNLIRSAAPYLNNAMVAQNFEFYGKTLSGSQEMRPRWKRVVNTVNNTLGEAVGEMYVKKYFSAESKTRALELVKNVQDALQERIQNLDWMTNATKEKAVEKLNTFHVKIGYPDTWRSYDALQISGDSYWANIQRSNVFDFDYMINKVGKPVDKDEWLMNPQMVNAYYNPTTNEICFPAGILQPPFFFADGDDAINYGAIGVVIGHEMTHGFDDQGRLYDKEGNLNNWWTEEDAAQFNVRAEALAAHFNQIVVVNDVHADGHLTLGENIADQGGLTLAYAALQKALKQHPEGKIDGFTPEQRFFLAYANVWAGNIREQEIIRLTKSDPHSLGRWRVNATLPHLQQFIDAFDIKENDAMYLPKEKRCLVW